MTALLSLNAAHRRRLLQAGALSLFGGMNLPTLLQAASADSWRVPGKARSVVLFNLLGGPSQLDMFDLKPDAPLEIRGEFSGIQTTVPGLQICEHLPALSQIMHRGALIRTVTHGYNAHNPLNIMTGWSLGNPGALTPSPDDPPDIGAVCQYLGMAPGNLPGAVCLPCFPGWGESSMYPGLRRPGPYGGFLGRQYDPLFSVCDPTFNKKPERSYYDTAIALGQPMLPNADSLPEMNIDRLDRRRSMLEQFDAEFARVAASRSIRQLDRFQQQAFALMGGSKVRDAFDLSHEPDAIRHRYGPSLFGNCMLVARKLVEASIPFISVHAENFLPNGSFTYDMHENNFAMLREHNLPVLDQILPAFIGDLEEHGLLDSTLVYVMGEMGRSPRINSKAGRDHWPQCGFCLMFGGGIREGVVHGTTDATAAYPASNPVSPADIVATIYHQLGIDPHTTVPDRSGRPIAVAHGGQVIAELL